MVNKKGEQKSFLATVERIGNKIPHTMALFLWLLVIIVAVSFVLSALDISVLDPISGEQVQVVNLLSITGLMELLTSFVANFASFPILGVTIVVGIAMGLCEAGGFFNTAVKYGLSNVKSSYIAFFVSFLGVFMCSFDGAVSHVVVPTLAATIYLSIGKNPMVGVVSGYAAAATGAAMEFVPAFWQVALTPLTVEYAQIVDPTFTMPLMSDYYAMVPASILAVVINTVVTAKVIEPRFGAYKGNTLEHIPEESLTDEQISAVKSALFAVAVFLVIVVAICIPQNSFMRSDTGSLVVDAPLMASFENLLFLLFFIPGYIYAKKTGKIKNINDLAALLEKGLSGLLSFIILVLVISQFLALFEASNLAKVIAISGGSALSNLDISPIFIIVIVFVSYAFVNLFIISGSTKYLLFGSFMIPMLMQMNFHPAFIQLMLRLADGSTNQLSPLNSFFPVVIALCAKYDKDSGVGTALSSMAVFAFWNLVVFLGLLLTFYFFELPLGFSGATVWR